MDALGGAPPWSAPRKDRRDDRAGIVSSALPHPGGGGNTWDAFGAARAGEQASADLALPAVGAWKPLWLQALQIWVVTRLALVAFTFAAALGQAAVGSPAAPSSPADLLGLWFRFDTTAYIHLVEWGYAVPAQAAFFPLYPLLISAGAQVLVPIFGPGSELVLALLLSNLGTLVAFAGLLKLALDEGSSEFQARMTILVLVAYPLAFFLGAGYTEGIFLACATWGLWAMRQGYWYRAAGCVLLAALCRPNGVMLLAPLLYEFARQHDWLRRIRLPAVPQGLAVASAAPAGVGLFTFYCWRQYGDPLEWLHAQTYWNRMALPPWQAVYDVASYLVTLPVTSIVKKSVDVVPLLLVVILTAALARRQPVAFTLYLVGLIAMAIASPSIEGDPAQHHAVFLSSGRFMLAAIPIFLVVGRWCARYPRLAVPCLFASFLLQAGLAILFLSNVWVD
jgi:hypothetical protein